MIKSDEDSLLSKYKVTKFPAFQILKQGEKKPIVYTEDDYSYSALFEFINVYSETFVIPTGDDENTESRASKPWLSEPVPFLSKDSANDVCLKKDGVLCVIYLVAQASQSDQAVINEMNYIKDIFTSKIERGITFNFMRLDVSMEPDFASIFALEEGDVPGIVVMNPGKKKRYLKHEYELTRDGMTNTLDKILGGDARFKMIKGDIPAFTQEHAAFIQ